jgi:hypothetical protein
LQQQATIFFEFLKDFKTNEKTTFSEFLNLLDLDKEIYILNLRSRLMKPNIFLNEHHQILKPMHLTYVLQI